MKLARKRQFGASSENSVYNQISLFNEAEVSADEHDTEPDITEVKAHYRKRTRLTTDKLPEDMPVEVIEYELPEAEKICPVCGDVMPCIGKEAREELKFIPAKAVLVRHVSHTHACRNCTEKDIATPIRKSALPKPVIKGSFASPEAVAHIMTQKFMMGSPLYRLEQEFKANGILLTRQTMSNWLVKASRDWLEPIYDALRGKLLKCELIHADEAPRGCISHTH
jgi:transposase